MKLTFRGAAKEVGRSCIDVESREGRFLLDCGVSIRPEGMIYPLELKDIEDIDAVFLTHAHLDHCGALAMEEHRGFNSPIFCTEETRELSAILLKDSHKIEEHSHGRITFDEFDVKRFKDNCKIVGYDQDREFNGVKFRLMDACHIPGSSSILLNFEGKNLFYTGDFNKTETRLVKQKLSYPEDVDVMITETTYGDRNHPDRKKTEKEFIESVKETVDSGGSVLVPAFAVSRAQELLMILNEGKFDAPIYLDGMATDVTKHMLGMPEFIKDKKALLAAFKNCELIDDEKERKRAVKSPGIFVTTSGMLSGGPAMEYVKHLGHTPENAILLTGFQGEGTNGRMLMETGRVIVDGFEFKIKCSYKKFDFSAHIGLKDLKAYVKKINPGMLMLNHGDPGAEDYFADWARGAGFKTQEPELLDSFKIS